jgi:integrase
LIERTNLSAYKFKLGDRCRKDYDRLNSCLRDNGIDISMPTHLLRAEAISKISDASNVAEAMRFAGHTDIATTTNSYLKRTREQVFNPVDGKLGMSSRSLEMADAPPFLPISDPFNGALKRPTQKANS